MRRTIGPDLRSAVATWFEARLYVATAFVITRAVVDRLEPPPTFTPVDDGLLAWDGTWYSQIADVGYLGADDPAVRFFPLWPLLGRFVGWFTGGPDLALVVMANLFALVAGVMLYRLVMLETHDARTAQRAVRILALFPPAFVLVLAYSEALFLVLGLGMVLSLRGHRWVRAAMLGYLAGLTRPVAGLLALSAAVAVWRQRAQRSPLALLSIAAAPAGSLTFLAWSAIALDDWSAPLDRQRELRGDITEPVGRLISAFTDAIRGDEGEAFHLIAALIIIGLTVVAIRSLSADLWAYTLPSTLLLISAENLNSMERYALGAFPLVIAAAIVSRRPVLDRWVPTTSAVGMVAVSVLMFNGVYVP